MPDVAVRVFEIVAALQECWELKGSRIFSFRKNILTDLFRSSLLEERRMSTALPEERAHLLLLSSVYLAGVKGAEREDPLRTRGDESGALSSSNRERVLPPSPLPGTVRAPFRAYGSRIPLPRLGRHRTKGSSGLVSGCWLPHAIPSLQEILPVQIWVRVEFGA